MICDGTAQAGKVPRRKSSAVRSRSFTCSLAAAKRDLDVGIVRNYPCVLPKAAEADRCLGLHIRKSSPRGPFIEIG